MVTKLRHLLRSKAVQEIVVRRMKPPKQDLEILYCCTWQYSSSSTPPGVSRKNEPLTRKTALTLLEPQSRFGDKSLKFQAVCPQNGTAVLKGVNPLATEVPIWRHNTLIPRGLPPKRDCSTKRANPDCSPVLGTNLSNLKY